jgi:hypothetical protein
MCVDLIFGLCTINQEDEHQNQEKNIQEISLNDYCQQHKGTWSRQNMRWKGMQYLPHSRKAMWNAGR